MGAGIKYSIKGFTFIEMILVVVIIAIMASVAIQKLAPMADTLKIERTKAEMDRLALAIVGNPDLMNGGVRTDFGYVGDIGSMPANLDALMFNPGFAAWNGPYLETGISQNPDDYKKDAWQAEYTYTGGSTIISTGSGNIIERRLAGSTERLLHNRVSGNIYDFDGTPPGNIYHDSLRIELAMPDGIGGTVTRFASSDIGGYFSLDSIPVGNHDLNIIYIPTADTIKRFISINPGADSYGEYYLPTDVWSATPGLGDFAKVSGSDSLRSDCYGFFFWIENNSGGPMTIDWITLTWSSPSAYYRYIIWDNTIVANRNNPQIASGETVALSGPQTINDGESLRLDFDGFKANLTGGANVNMNDVDFTVEFSNGTVISMSTGSCP